MTNRNVAKLLIASSFSDLANWIYKITILTYVIERYNSAFSSSLLSLMMVMPAVLFGYLAGQLADSKNKKTIMVFSDLSRILLIGILCLFEFSSFIIVLFVSTVAVFSDVCEDSIVPELAKEDELAQINSVYSLVSSIIMIGGPTIGGLIAAHLAKEHSTIIVLILLLIAMFIRTSITYKKPKGTIRQLPKNKISGFDVFCCVKNSKLKNIVITTGLIAFAGGMLNSLLLLFVYNILGKNSTDYGIMLSVKGAAMTITATILLKLASKMDGKKMYTLSIVGMGVALIIFPLNKNWPLAIALQATNAAFNIVYSVTRKTLIQQNCELTTIGRFLGSISVVGNISSIISLIVFGCLADYIGIEVSLLVGGIVVLSAGVISMNHMRISKHGTQ